MVFSSREGLFLRPKRSRGWFAYCTLQEDLVQFEYLFGGVERCNMAKRIQARVSDDMYDKLSMWAERLGVNMSQLSGMAIQAGLDSIIRAVSPVESLSPGQWAVIFKAMQEQGIDMNGIQNIGGEDEKSPSLSEK